MSIHRGVLLSRCVALALLLAACGGEHQPAHEPAPAVVKALTARGQEPGWTLSISDKEIDLVTRYGEQRATFPTPPPTIDGSATHYVLENPHVIITIVGEPCADAMSGMLYPLTVTVETEEETLRGCGGDPADLLEGDAWVVEDIAGTGVIDGSNVTLQFGDDGRLSGLASCNTYTATWTLSDEGISLGPAAATRKACAPALMDQENRFLAVLATVRRFEISPEGALVLRSDDGAGLFARR